MRRGKRPVSEEEHPCLWRHALAQGLAHGAIGGLCASLLDMAVTGASEEEIPLDLSAALGIFAFDSIPWVAASVLVALVLCAVAPSVVQDPRAALLSGLRRLWPEDAARRARDGAALLAWAVAAGCFLIMAYLLALTVFESVRTTTFAAAAVSLLSLPAALLALGLGHLLARRARSLVMTMPKVANFASPLVSLLVCICGIAVVLALKASAVQDVLAATDLSPYWIATAGLAACLTSALVARWPRTARLGVAFGLPGLMLLSAILVLAAVGHDNDSRILVTTRARLAPLGYRAFKVLLDFDGDGRLSMYGEGDCAPFDPSGYSGAIEVPNNGIDEDCDGEDLDLTVSSGKPRWDFVVPGEARGRYNVVLLSIDAVAPAHMSLYGYHRPTTPFIEELARQGVWFPWAYSQGPSTRLAFPAMWTSRYDSQIAHAIGARIPLELLPANLTMAEVLRSAGYRTIAVLPVKFISEWKGIAQGFDVVNTDPVDDYKAPVFHNADKVTEAALGELTKVASAQPVFLWLHYFDPHGPYTPPPVGPRYGGREEDIYDAEMAYTDAEIRRFVEGLWKVLPRDRTILILTGDHGESFDPAHPNWHHGFDLHSSVLHLPLLVVAPFLKPLKVEMPVTTMDLLPTLVNLLDIKGDFQFEGASLVPQLFGEPPDEHRAVFHEFYLNENIYHKKRALQHVAIRTWSMYLIHDLTNNTYQLYRYRTDPFETENLYSVMPEAAAVLRVELARFAARVARGQ